MTKIQTTKTSKPKAARPKLATTPIVGVPTLALPAFVPPPRPWDPRPGPPATALAERLARAGVAIEPMAPRPSPPSAVETRRYRVYGATCAGLDMLGAALGLPLVKIGITVSRVSKRVAHLGESGYAGFLAPPSVGPWDATGGLPPGTMRVPGVESWNAVALGHASASCGSGLDLRLSPMPLVEIEDGSFAFDLPAHLDREEADEALRALLAPCALDDRLGTQDGARRLALAGLDPALRPHTLYRRRAVATVTEASDAGSRPPRFSLAREIYVLDTQADAAALLDALVRLVATLRRLSPGEHSVDAVHAVTPPADPFDAPAWLPAARRAA